MRETRASEVSAASRFAFGSRRWPPRKREGKALASARGAPEARRRRRRRCASQGGVAEVMLTLDSGACS
ncbi:Hypothetical predicted protein [Podarcis lilfordi]|uniref:Uncharacterized protein n=1 Tax=Podarcis lilfordi TaxID=74358 RepID=A0AA35K9N4_9SAUR|nr:Hypothetical predicted protein [Podarcis lilfordi]